MTNNANPNHPYRASLFWICRISDVDFNQGLEGEKKRETITKEMKEFFNLKTESK